MHHKDGTRVRADPLYAKQRSTRQQLAMRAGFTEAPCDRDHNQRQQEHHVTAYLRPQARG